MKQIILLLVAGTLSVGCDKNDDNTQVDRTIETTFHNQHPDAIRVEWDANNGNSTHQPSSILSAVKMFITEKYPQARIVDIENKHNTIEVDIVDDRTSREVIFTLSEEWICTKTEVRKTNIQAVVLNALNASQYGSWRIDNIDHYVTPTNEYYLLELESGNREIHLKIDINGNLL